MHHACCVDIDSTELLITLTGEKSVRAIALRAQYDPSTLTRQLKSGIKAETVIDIARSFNMPVVGALVSFGFLTQAEAELAESEVALALATDEQLAQEILDRVKKGNASGELTEPIKVTPENVSSMDHHRQRQSELEHEDAFSDSLAVASLESEDRGEEGDGYDA